LFTANVLRSRNQSTTIDSCDAIGSEAIERYPNCILTGHMTRPDLPNFSIGGRVAVGVIVVVVIIAMLRLFSVF